MNLKWIVAFSLLVICENGGILGKDARVKLCGREFIRMVVTLCGSSRLRRCAPETDPASVSPQLNRNDGGLFSDLTPLQKRSEDDQTHHRSSEEVLNSSSFAFLTVMKSVEAQSFRLQRDLGPAGVCCRSGCTKTELVQYC